MKWFSAYSSCLTNLFFILTLFLFVNTFAKQKRQKYSLLINTAYILVWIPLTIAPSVPYFTLVTLFLDFVYIWFYVSDTLYAKILLLVKFKLYFYVASIIIGVIHTIITLDILIYGSNKTYVGYVHIICNFTLYTSLAIYIISRQLLTFPSGKVYRRYFLLTICTIILLLILCSMMLESQFLSLEEIVFIFFSLLLIITLLCLSIYRKFLLILEENTITKLEAEKNALQQNYYTNVEKNLKSLALLRHDFKNHLIIIQNYAASSKTDELLNYIDSLYDGLTPTALIETASPVISSIINAKKEECESKEILLTYEQDFGYVNISDFNILTILGNLLDNAITAASKCRSGYINLKISNINDSYLEIDCTNNHTEQIQKKKGRFLTTKNTEKASHGLGIPSMQRTIENLHGEISINYTDDAFHVNILIPNH